ncbi:periplasmic protein CpxP [Mariprofundus micogutta]|uniref:Periplasmic protein CpxP n=1 Tax=Mariprofundus micogutta TaxID=1921010 RepID=A0A1L8CPD5_9PROT|nr:Spy/CpxP family protein refolding chaperone [Mariprofundus micogutta]GAV20782.1 periplasmic protein CpxP [Mariprofundus micogutta]
MTQTYKEPSNWITVLSFAVAAMLAVSFANMAYAFPPGGGGGMQRMERMADELNLTDQQRQQFKQIHRDNRGAGMIIRDAMQDNRDAMQKLDPGAKGYSKQVAKLADEKADLVKQMTVHRAEVRAEIHAILTPEQRTKAAELKKNFRKGGKGGFGRGGPGSGRCNN